MKGREDALAVFGGNALKFFLRAICDAELHFIGEFVQSYKLSALDLRASAPDCANLRAVGVSSGMPRSQK